MKALCIINFIFLFSTTLIAQEDSLDVYFDNNHEHEKSSFLTVDLFKMIPVFLFPRDFSIIYEKKVIKNLRAELGLGMSKGEIFFPFYNKEQDPLKYTGILRVGLKIVKPFIQLDEIFGSYLGFSFQLHNLVYTSYDLLHIKSGFTKELLLHYGFHIKLSRFEIKPFFGLGVGFCKFKIADQTQFDLQNFPEKFRYSAFDAGLRLSYRLD